MKGLLAACVVAALSAAASRSDAADVLGITPGDSPGLAVAKLKDYAMTAYGAYYVNTVEDGTLKRAQERLRAGGTEAQMQAARELVETPSIEVHTDADAEARLTIQYVAANLLPVRQTGSFDNERITVVFSGFASANVAFKVQRYLVFKRDQAVEIQRSAPAGVKGLSLGVGTEALRNSLTAIFGKPISETKTEVPQHEEADSHGERVGGIFDVLAYRLDPLTYRPTSEAIEASLLARCVDHAESADLAFRHTGDTPPQVDLSKCPALLVARMYSDRDVLVTRFDELLVDYPRMKSLSDTEAAASTRGKAAIEAVRAAGTKLRAQIREEQMAAALHGPVGLRY